MAQQGKIKFWTVLIPLAIGVIFVVFDIWPGKSVRTFRVVTHQSKRELVGAFGEDDWEWFERGKGYMNRKKEMTRHGKWVETCRDQFSGAWRCEGEYENSYRDGRWVVTRNGELFREYIFDEGKMIKISRKSDSD